MPHMFTNRPKNFDLTDLDAGPEASFRWETLNAVIYKLGGAVFMAGSVMFFPRFDAYMNIGAWLFCLGSLLYLVVTGHDLIEVRRFWRRHRSHTPGEELETTAASSYLGGTLLFTAGSLFFLSWWGWYIAGTWCFVIGSGLFVVGSSVNVLQIVKAHSLVTMQLMNLTAVTFVVGSTLFVVASIPYLWTITSAGDHAILFTFIAWQYLAGSSLFFLGGVFNYYRAYLVMLGQVRVPRAP